MVWAHLKLDTNNKEDIMPYLKRNSNSSSINEGPESLLSEHNAESQDLTTSPLTLSSKSIFEESSLSESARRRLAKPLVPTTFCDKLDSIGEFDPYGASLVSLLSRTRALTLRDSIPIT
jgi:hypothetical protein